MNDVTRLFIRQHAQHDVRLLALQGCKDPAVDMAMALNQIAGLQTAQRKLPTWAACEEVVYPPHLNMEQCSSEVAARYKARVVARLVAQGVAEGTAPMLVDLTGGMGVDFSWMAPACGGTAVYVEREERLCGLARHNLQALGVEHATVVCADGEDYLHQLAQATVIYLDPARRDSHGGRTYDMGDCTPNVLALREELVAKAQWVVLKLSPMLDWRKAVADLGPQHVREVHVVAVGGECKELLVVMGSHSSAHFDGGDSTELFVVNDDHISVACSLREAALPAPTADGVEVGQWVHEPHAAVMKAGCFGVVARQWGVSQVAPSSHLFVSRGPVDDFPGRSFQVVGHSTLNKRELRTLLSGRQQANVTVRNFPLSVAELRRRLKLSEGGSDYIFATTLASGQHILLLTQKEKGQK